MTQEIERHTVRDMLQKSACKKTAVTSRHHSFLRTILTLYLVSSRSKALPQSSPVRVNPKVPIKHNDTPIKEVGHPRAALNSAPGSFDFHNTLRPQIVPNYYTLFLVFRLGLIQ